MPAQGRLMSLARLHRRFYFVIRVIGLSPVIAASWTGWILRRCSDRVALIGDVRDGRC